MILQILLLILGFGLLVKGADWLVDGASALAKKNRVSDLAIGLTVVAFGTSTPELVVNSFASYQNHGDIVFGNVIGSNNFNLFVILGIAGLITPLVVQSSTVWKEIPFSFLGVLLLFFLIGGIINTDNQVLSRIDGMILLMLFILFLLYVFKQLKTDVSELTVTQKNFSVLKMWGFILIGLAALVTGGRLVVTSAVEMATGLGVSEVIIGLTIIAAGTSLPELATSVVAAIKKNNDIAVGNIIGSNIFNIFFILGISSLIRPVDYNDVFNRDLYLLAAGTIILFAAMFISKKKKLERWEAAILVLLYIIYIIYLINNDI
ncbi:MAG: calcium/sodium antiporter [Cyclobacteriaceae bacterium]|nr:calcium/sodium antiporter [Cyclobacteriaceae bacterium]